MKKALKTQLFAAIAMMVVAAIALTSVAYAWFTSIANPEVQALDLYVKAADSMFLSEFQTTTGRLDINNATYWDALISKGEIEAEQTDVFAEDLTHVSNLFNGDSSTFYIVNHDNAGNPTGYTADLGDGSFDGSFTRFTLWVKSTNDGYVFINGKSFVKGLDNAIISSGAFWTDGSNPKSYIDCTIRVGFVPLDYDTDGAAGTDITPAVARNAAWDNAVIWEPNAKKHLPANPYGGPGGADVLITDAIKGTTTAAADKAVQITQTLIDDDDTSKIPLFDLRADYAQEFAVYIWVEGQDADTVNAVAKSYFQTNLVFGQEKGEKIDTTNFKFASDI